MGHSKLETWLEAKLPHKAVEFSLLREVRETVNYLGVGDPVAKLRVVRGHPFGFRLGKRVVGFKEMVGKVSEHAKNMIREVVSRCPEIREQTRIQILADQRETWLEQYLGEDVLLGVLSTEQEREILKRSFALLKPDRSGE